MSAKFNALAAKVGSKQLAGWITTHNPKVRARAIAARSKKKTARALMMAGKTGK